MLKNKYSLPGRSPGLLLLVVAEIDLTTLPFNKGLANNALCRVVLPHPEGPEIITILALKINGSLFDIVGLFADFLNLAFDGDHSGGNVLVLDLGADGIGLSLHFLGDKIKLFA